MDVHAALFARRTRPASSTMVGAMDCCFEIAGCDIMSAKRGPFSAAVMSLLDREARMRRRGASESASKNLIDRHAAQGCLQLHRDTGAFPLSRK